MNSLSKDLQGRDHTEDLGINGNMKSEWILGKQDGKIQNGFIWLKIGTSGGLLQTQ
jgi:hypothetical protein